jgi:hypothetical protein
MLATQNGKCDLCRTPIKATQIPVLDHDHSNGAIRGVLHHSCNAVLGVVENNAGRYGLLGLLYEFCSGLGQYMQKHRTNITGLIHPTHLTDDEKRLKRNAKAVKARAKKRLAQ